MRTLTALVAGLALTVALSGCSRPSGAAAAADAMGATALNSIQYSGTGSNYAFGQAYTPGGPWPRFEVKAYTAAVDYDAPAMRVEMLRAQGENPPRGGGAQPFAVEQRTIQVVNGTHAWTEGGAQPAPNPAAVRDRVRSVWLTPHGIVKAAMTSPTPPEGNTFTVRVDDRDVTVTLDGQNLVTRVAYLITNPVVGDVPVEVTYSDYAEFGGIRFPRRIVEKQDGFDTLDLAITDVTPNAAVSLPVPANVASAPAPPAAPVATVDKVGDGLWSLTAAGTRSLAVEFADHIVMLEGPTSDARSKAVNELVRRTVPNKPIRFVVNTHAHYDHAGGLRQYVAEGITVITHESNKAFFEKAWARPRTVEPDPAPTSSPPTIETVGDQRVLTDRTRTIELHYLPNHGHHTGQLIAYLPRERILMYGDGYNPPAGDEIRTPERGPDYAAQLAQRVRELKLNPERIAPVHGRVVPYRNLLMAFNLEGAQAGTR
jgi:glyoxylase-like metal-dependent hydrolase (beta-lactamase superfamily II)